MTGSNDVYVVDSRDFIVTDCPHADGFGEQCCGNCACAYGTVYADGYQSGCVNVPPEAVIEYK